LDQFKPQPGGQSKSGAAGKAKVLILNNHDTGLFVRENMPVARISGLLIYKEFK